MRNHLVLILFSILVLFTACNKDEKGSLTLRFQARSDNNPAVMFQTFDGVNPYPLQFSHLSMLISDIELLSPDGNEMLADVELVDMSFDNEAAATGGFTVRYDEIPAKTYSGIRFGIGVPPDVNAKVPADFPSSSPLSKTGYYWLPWSSYIFMKTEGRIDTLPAGDFETNFALHTGSDALYRILEANTVSIAVNDGQDTELTVAVDYANLLEGIDIAAMPQNHNPEDTVQISQIVNNLQTAITLFQ